MGSNVNYRLICSEFRSSMLACINVFGMSDIVSSLHNVLFKQPLGKFILIIIIETATTKERPLVADGERSIAKVVTVSYCLLSDVASLSWFAVNLSCHSLCRLVKYIMS